MTKSVFLTRVWVAAKAAFPAALIIIAPLLLLGDLYFALTVWDAASGESLPSSASSKLLSWVAVKV